MPSFLKKFMNPNSRAKKKRSGALPSAKVEKRCDDSVNSTDASHCSDQRERNPPGKKPFYATSLTCTKKVPMSAINCNNVSKVIQSWEHGLKRIPDWDRNIGMKLTRKIFELAPQTIEMFGFPSNTKYDDPALSSNKAFVAKSTRLINAIDMTIACLIPDVSFLKKKFQDLGARHVALGCRPSHWPIVGAALLFVLEECLKEQFTDDVKESWMIVYNFTAFYMIRGLLKEDPRLSEPMDASGCNEETEPSELDKTYQTARIITWDCSTRVPATDISFQSVCTVVESWERGIKRIPNWSNKLGPLWVRYIFKACDADCKKLMGYNEHTEWDDPTLTKDTWFIKKGERLIGAIDTALTFLGPDLSPLVSDLVQLGRRHYHMGCKPHHWPIVGEALFDLFRGHMGEDGRLFTAEVETAWKLIYRFLGYHMIQGMIVEEKIANDRKLK